MRCPGVYLGNGFCATDSPLGRHEDRVIAQAIHRTAGEERGRELEIAQVFIEGRNAWISALYLGLAWQISFHVSAMVSIRM